VTTPEVMSLAFPVTYNSILIIPSPPLFRN
jgi:hypothetical protein